MEKPIDDEHVRNAFMHAFIAILWQTSRTPPDRLEHDRGYSATMPLMSLHAPPGAHMEMNVWTQFVSKVSTGREPITKAHNDKDADWCTDYIVDQWGDISDERPAMIRTGDLITKPRMVLADEPTGSVDPVTSREIHKLFKELNSESGISFLIVTHSKTTASISHRSMELVDGRFVAQHEDVDVTDLKSSRKFLIDESGRSSIPQEILASTGRPGMFELISNDKNEIKLIRHLSNDKESELKERLAEKCIACGYQFTSMDESQCPSCGALR